MKITTYGPKNVIFTAEAAVKNKAPLCAECSHCKRGIASFPGLVKVNRVRENNCKVRILCKLFADPIRPPVESPCQHLCRHERRKRYKTQ